MVPNLRYREINDINEGEHKSVGHFLDMSLKFHKAPVLDKFYVELGPHCPVDVDVGKWIINAVDRKVIRNLKFELEWSAKPINLPKSLYTCDTLVFLSLSHKIFVDIVGPALLPSLKTLYLERLVYKDEDSLVKLLSSCPTLRFLYLERHKEDKLRNVKIKVSSLETLLYVHEREDYAEDNKGSLVIDSPMLKTFVICDHSGDSCSIKNTDCLNKATIIFGFYPGGSFMRYPSSLVCLDIVLDIATIEWCTTINFPQLIKCSIHPFQFDWLEPVLVLLQNSPKLKVLLINTDDVNEDIPISWNHPASVPNCLLALLEIFEWEAYGGSSEEKELVRYILANSMCLKRIAISIKSTSNLEDREKMIDELKSMSRISESSQLMFNTKLVQDPDVIHIDY